MIDSLTGWSTITALIVAGSLGVAWLFPPFRKYALVVIGAALTALTLYARGYRAAQERERERKEKAVRKAQEKYNEIDSRPDDVNSVTDRLRRHDF